jgi:hypothetical protein
MTAFDSPEWRFQRNEKLATWVQDPAAISFMLAVADASELFDDVVDNDKPIEAGHVERVAFSLLAQLPLNPFFDRFKTQLCPIMHTGINAWLDATAMEKDYDLQERSYVLRDWNLELLLHVVYLTRGRDYMRSVSLDIRKFFLHETLDEYREKLL